MKRIGRIIATTITILTLTLALGIATSRTVRAAVTALVTVANTPANPVPVTELPPTQPFQASCSSSLVAIGFDDCTIAIPAGKRLVVQTVSVHTFVDPGVGVSDGSVSSTYNGTGSRLYLSVPYTGSFSIFGVNATTQDVHLYADSTDGLSCFVRYSRPTSQDALECDVVGYLVDMP